MKKKAFTIPTILALILCISGCGTKSSSTKNYSSYNQSNTYSTFANDNDVTLDNNSDSLSLPNDSIGDLRSIASFEKSANMKSNIGTCVATDGEHMYVADGIIKEYGSDGTIINSIQEPAYSIAFADNMLICSVPGSIRIMDRNGNNVKEISTENSLSNFCYQNGRVFFFKKNISSISHIYHLCSVDITGSDFINYEQVGTKFIYADYKAVYFGYMDSEQGIYINYYNFEDKAFHKSFNKVGSEARVYELNLNRISANGKNIFFTTGWTNSELGIYRLGMSGSDRKKLETQGFSQIICCGNRLYLVDNALHNIQYYDLDKKEFSKIYGIVYAAYTEVLDIFGDYVFVAADDMNSCVRIQKFDELEDKINEKKQ